MARTTGFDEFDDAQNGIWAGSDAVSAMTQYHKKHTPLGIEVSRTCEGCQVEVTSLISWAEVFCVSNKVFPHEVGLDQWAYNKKHHVMHPVIMCSHCAQSRPTPVFFPMGPNEAKNEFTRAAGSGVIDPRESAVIHKIAPAIKQLLEQHARRR